MAKFPTYEEMGKKVAEEALDEFLYDGKSIREWMQIIASKDAISRQAVLDVTWEEPSYTDALNVLTEVRDKVKALPSVNPQKPICPSAGIDCEDCPAYEKKSEWQQDHEILKAYSDGANDVLDKIRDEIREQSRMHMDGDLYIKTSSCMQIINEYKAEEVKE